MVFLQNKSMVRGSSVGTEDSPMPKLAYDIWIKRYNNNLPLTSINLCAQSEIYERDRERERERERGEGERGVSGRERERERERRVGEIRVSSSFLKRFVGEEKSLGQRETFLLLFLGTTKVDIYHLVSK
jgi:hypothetical protein